MGNGYSSRTNLGNNCTSFEAGETGTIARWGDSLEVSMGNWKQDNTEFWGVEYKKGKKLEHSCGYQLRAKRDENGVESIYFGLSDSADNKIGFCVNITRVGHDGLCGGIKGIQSPGSYKSFTSAKQDYTIETTIVSYDCSYRDGLFVLQMRKMNYSEYAYMVTMAHYYVTKAVGLYAAATIQRSKGKGFEVEVKGPMKCPSVDLRRAIDETRRTGILSPGAESNTQTGDSNSSFKSGTTVGQIVKHASNTALINSNGYTDGNLNNSIFVGCKIM